VASTFSVPILRSELFDELNLIQSEGLIQLMLELHTEEELTFSIVDLIGRETFLRQTGLTAGVNTMTLPLPDLPSGLYFLQMESSSGELLTKRIRLD
jgi:hypothetical protein